MKDVRTLMRTYNFQPKKTSGKRASGQMTVKEHIENSFWAFEQIVSLKDEIDKVVSSKLGTTQREQRGPEASKSTGEKKWKSCQREGCNKNGLRKCSRSL